MKRNNKKGFTIVELVIVVAVIAILAGVLIPTFVGVVAEAQSAAAVSEAKTAYQQYIYAHTEDATMADDFIYIYAEEKVVVIRNGKVLDTVYGSDDLALASMEIDTTQTATAVDTDVEKLYVVTITTTSTEGTTTP